MNNLKKIGLTALAGSLAASTAYAGVLEVTGSAGVKYQSRSGSTGGSTSVQGNPWSDSNGITFSGSGEMDNGMTVGVSYTMSDAAFSTSNVTLDMGDSGMLAFGHDSAKGGIDTIKDKMPTAGEEVWDDIGSGDDAGVTDVGADASLYYKVSMNGITASASYARTGLGTDNSIAIVASELPLSFKIDLSSIKIIAVKPEFPVRILSPSERTVPGFNLEKSFVSTGIISTSPFTLVATAILVAIKFEDNNKIDINRSLNIFILH